MSPITDFLKSVNGLLAAAGVAALIGWGWLHAHDTRVRVKEITRQETNDAQTAARARSAVRNPSAQRVLDPTTLPTDTAGQ